MELSHRSEEILETLWVELNERNKKTDVTVLKNDTAFKELLEKKYLSLDNKNLFTTKGLEEGRLCVRRHRLAECLLVDVLHVRDNQAHDIGCELEHILKKGLEDNICILLGHPETCPHGTPIPKGKCCLDKKKKLESFVQPLSELKKGRKGTIAYIHTHDKDMLNKIMAMGALPGLPIKVLHRFPSYVFKIGESQFAIDKKIAEKIYVWLK
jgi:DtxR family transcriptional regulator, Mn-dependent transcriptional regulator